ncbi:MAG TPA: hypothetical protein VIZ28_15830 [Chitinophagaceae bacterium]
MRIVLTLMIVAGLGLPFFFTACGPSGPATFCDTTCNNDTLRFSIDHPDRPFVAIGMKNCLPDTITWSHAKLTTKRKLPFAELTGKEVHINKNFIRYYIKDTSYAWILFNECINGQGFLVKIPFNKTDNIFRKNSGLNSLDPKFYVAENLAAYTDKGNVFVEEMATGKKATMTFGRQIDNMDYNDIHETLDSINVTADRVWVKVKIDNEWQVKEKKITLQ